MTGTSSSSGLSLTRSSLGSLSVSNSIFSSPLGLLGDRERDLERDIVMYRTGCMVDLESHVLGPCYTNLLPLTIQPSI